ncbi:alpha-amylase family protein [Paraferrimonas sp. SM1919]|uniref:alpha-amylase family protein n=1 Tax=Paraferrimonas sp. SM1919 TaxID=2662263 RepID=UPI0013D5CE68|nr:alpha-amylase family protein [Paraferrimonas sp. SM1919]
MRLSKLTSSIVVSLALVAGCSEAPKKQTNQAVTVEVQMQSKPVIYQVFTRLWGNQNDTNKPWGTIEENGVGKFNDFNDAALEAIKELGSTHVWYTGVLHHGVIRDYTDYGIANDDPDVVKGRAGSPYAIKDYYNVNPDMAVDPAARMAEFEALIARTHKHGMKVIIDIVPNHVARNYASTSKPEGVVDLGANDDTSVTYARNNDFYYVEGQDFIVPDVSKGDAPLGGEAHPLADGKFAESPAKWTGNGARAAQPNMHDWYETVKINYGVRPDGSEDFPQMDDSFRNAPTSAHYDFWQGKDVPPSWHKMRDIAFFWLDKGVDGFRFDMAEMVPAEFWSYLNSHIKHKNPDAALVAEVYNPTLYKEYIDIGRMDYLYDKVGFYDALKLVMQDKGGLEKVIAEHDKVLDIEEHMLHFLENHDEQRIASPDFAGDAEMGRPAMVYSTLVGTSPTLMYFAQEFGEDGSEMAGFGKPTRTSIFDYVGVPSLIRFNNGGNWDGGKSTDSELKLHDFYKRLLPLSKLESVREGEYLPLFSQNLAAGTDYPQKVNVFARYTDSEKLVVLNNFSYDKQSFTLTIPSDLATSWKLDNSQAFSDVLNSKGDITFTKGDNGYTAAIELDGLQSAVYRLAK